MNEQNPSDPKTPLNQQKGASPLPGCIIVIVTILVFGGLAVLYIGVGYWMNSELDAITSPEPAKLIVSSPDQQQKEAVYEKLRQLKKATESEQMIRVSFSAEDINTLIATDPLLADLKGKAYVDRIDSEGIQTKVNQQLRSLPMRPDRFLNATITFVPVVLKDSVVFEIRNVHIPDKEVPQGFIEGYSKQDFYKLDTKNEVLKPVLLQLRRTYLEANHIIVETGREPIDG